MKLVRALIAAALAVGAAAAIQMTGSTTVSAQVDTWRCVACWNSEAP